MGEAKRLRDRLKAEQDRSEREEKMHRRAQKAEGEIATLRAEVERLREALVMIASDARFAQEFYDRNGPQWTSPQGNEYEDTSAYLAKMEELHTIAKEALK